MLTRHQPASLQTYESLARKGEAMTTAAMVTYAFDRIEQARAELESGLEIDDIRESQYLRTVITVNANSAWWSLQSPIL